MFKRLATIVTTMAVLVLLVVAPVSAKGPDSAFLSGPGFDEPVDLIGMQWTEMFGLLMEQTGLWFGVGDLPDVIADPGTPSGPRYELTWVNSGPPALPQIERTIVQYLYLQDDGRVLIHTPNQGSLSGWGQSVIGWFQAPSTFVGTLAELGADLDAASTTVAQGEAPATPESDGGWLTAAGVVLLLAVGVGLWQMTQATKIGSQPMVSR